MAAVTRSRASRLAVVTALAVAAIGAGGQDTFAAQVTPPRPPGAYLRFEHLTIADGLSQNTVTDILQDRKGYLWFATENGLHRYDGYRFDIFQHEPSNPASLSGNYVTAVAPMADGRILVGTGTAGLNVFDPATGRFDRPGGDGTPGSGLSHPRVWDVAEDRDGRIWVATDDGLNRIDGDGSVRVYRYDSDEPDGLASNVVRTLLVDSGGTLWVGSFGGLNVVDAGSDRLRRFATGGPGSEALKGANVAALHEDSDGVLWAGLGATLARIAPARDAVTLFPRTKGEADEPANLITDIVTDGRGNLWISTDGDGIQRLRPGANRFDRFDHEPADPGSIGDGFVNAAYRDAADVLWFGTASGGVSKLNPAIEAFAHYRRNLADRDSLPSNVVWSLFEDTDGSVWVATEAGLARLDSTTGRYRQVRATPPAGGNEDTSNLFYYVHRDKAGRLWAGTGEGLYLVDEASGRLLPRYAFEDAPDAEYAPVIHMIREDDRGRLWLGSFNGLVRYEPDTGASTLWRRDRDSLNNNWVMDIANPGDGTLWIGSEGGLSRIDADSGQVLESIGADPADARALTHPSVQSLALDGAGRLWVATASGLQALDPGTGRFTRYNVDAGLPSDYVYGVAVDRNELVWASTNRGLARLDPATGQIAVFDVSDGLQGNEFNTGAVHRGASGRLYFGGINGFNAFEPGQVVQTVLPPRVAITSVRVLGRQWREATGDELRQGVTLSPSETVFTLRFAAFDYKAPAGNRFRFRLTGFDGDWRDAGASNSVTYTNLDPGRYRFELRGANSDGVWSPESVTLPIGVEPPFWSTWYAYLLYALLVSASVVAALRAWTARVRREQAFRVEQQRRAQAERLQQYSEELSASLDADVMADRLAGAAADLAGYERAYLYRVEEAEPALVGVWPPQARDGDPLSSADAGVRTMWRSHIKGSRPLTITGSLPSDALVVPWSGGRGSDGALVLVAAGDASYSAADVRLVSILVNQARVAFENARLFSEVQQLAITDDLTGLNNRRHFLHLANREFLRSTRYGTHLSVALLDADHFKTINDRYGHAAGDVVLKRLASICLEATREFDVVGRYGGEEFVVLLPETPRDIAAHVAERIRHTVAECDDLGPLVQGMRLTISAGVATRVRSTADLSALIAEADGALYEAKEQGRNCTVVAGGGSPRAVDAASGQRAPE